MTFRNRANGARTDGLVQLPDLGRIQTVLGAAACFLTFATLLATSAVDLFAPVPKRKAYGLEALAQAPSGGWRTGDAARRIETHLSDHSRVRRRAHSLYAIALHRFLREGGERVVVGKNDTLFLKDRLILSGLSETQAVTNTTLLAATVARRFEARGVPFLFMAIPRKAVLDAESLPDGVEVLAHFDASLLRRVQEMGVETVELLQEFSGDAPQHVHYFPEDSHWNFETRVDAFRVLGKRLRPDGNGDSSTSLSRPFPSKDPRDIQHFLGALSDDLERFSDEPMSMFQRVDSGPEAEPSALPRKSAWIFGTSFTAFPYLPALLKHYSAYEVRSLSQVGRDPLTVLVERERAGDFSGPLPDVCVYEYPIHLALRDRDFRRQFAHITGLPEAGGSLKLTAPYVLALHPHALAKEPDLAASRPLGWIEPARLLRQANGAVLLRLRARLAPRVPTRVQLELPNRTLSANWPEGRRTCDVPVPAENGGGDRIDLSLLSPEGVPLDLVLEGLELLLDVEQRPFQVAKVLPRQKARRLAGSHWQQHLLFDPPLNTGAGKYEILFEIRTGEDSQRPFELRGIAPDGTQSDGIQFQGVQRLGYVTFPNSMMGGLEISTLEILGSGPMPAQFVVQAAAYRAAPAPAKTSQEEGPR